ncbi:MAG: HAD-IB family phosphatase [Bacteroidota bacterium]|nr:HAD-IB family phosphatase [Bacteroidota bacterium]
MVETPGSYPFQQGVRAVLFCDFDGTLTPSDIGATLFCKYSIGAVLENQLRGGEISALDYYQHACAALSAEATPEFIAEYALRIGFRPYARELCTWCQQHGIGVAVVSDGLDAYIMPVLAAEGLEDIPVACNRLQWDLGKPRVSFPWASESCQRNCPSPYPCAACKRAVLLSWTPPGASILYLGEGASDFCPALYADIVFASGELAVWCSEQKIGFVPYNTLFDVRRSIEQLLRQRRLSPRYLPQQRRQQAWVEE